MARTYTVSFEYVAVSAAQDLFAFKGSTGKTCKLQRFVLGPSDTTLPAAQALRINVKYASATITLGSGGTAPTPTKTDAGDAAASFTCRVNDTTPATTSGGFTNLMPVGVYTYAGIDFPWTKGAEPVFGLNEGVVIELLSTVSAAHRFSGTAWIEETGS